MNKNKNCSVFRTTKKLLCFLTMFSITSYPSYGSAFNLGDLIPDKDVVKSIFGVAGPCVVVGAAAEKIVGKDKVKELQYASTASCIVIAAKMKYDYEQAIAREKEIDKLIAQELMINDKLDRMNTALEKEILGLKRDISNLEAVIAADKAAGFEMTALLQKRKDTLPELLPIVEETILKAEKELKGSSLNDYQRKTLPGIISRLKFRKSLFEEAIQDQNLHSDRTVWTKKA